MATRKAGLTMGAALKAAAGVKLDKIQLADLKLDGGTQPRQQIDEETVTLYAERMERQRGEVLDPEGKAWEPLVVYYDGESYWLADGYHRVKAARQKGWTDYPADIRQGTLRDAVAYSLGANARHGKPRTNADKRRAVMRALVDAEWSKLSDRELARMCAVTHPMVGKIRAELELQRIEDERRVVTPSTFSPTEQGEAHHIDGIPQHNPGKVLRRDTGGGLTQLDAPPPRTPDAPLFEPRPITAADVTPAPLEIPRVGIAVLKEAHNKLAALIMREPTPVGVSRALAARDALKPHGVYLMRIFNDSISTVAGGLSDLDAEWLVRLVQIGFERWAVLHRRGALFPNHFRDEEALITELREMDGEIWELR